MPDNTPSSCIATFRNRPAGQIKNIMSRLRQSQQSIKTGYAVAPLETRLEFRQSLFFNLPHTLTGDSHKLGRFFKCMSNTITNLYRISIFLVHSTLPFAYFFDTNKMRPRYITLGTRLYYAANPIFEDLSPSFLRRHSSLRAAILSKFVCSSSR